MEIFKKRSLRYSYPLGQHKIFFQVGKVTSRLVGKCREEVRVLADRNILDYKTHRKKTDELIMDYQLYALIIGCFSRRCLECLIKISPAQVACIFRGLGSYRSWKLQAAQMWFDDDPVDLLYFTDLRLTRVTPKSARGWLPPKAKVNLD